VPKHTSSSLAWVSIEAAAAHFDLSISTVRRMVARGEIEARRFGPRLIRVNLESIVEYASPLAVVA